ncbi:MAG: MFS transporter [Oligoflexia bacterium]|nr:MFS transporter [Oligoflexia bacterium]
MGTDNNTENTGSNKKAIFLENFSAFTHRNFRYYWGGLLVSIVGCWMQYTAQSWLVITMTNSPLKLGLLGSAQFVPILIFSLFAGAIIDHLPKRQIIFVTQFISMLMAILLTVLTFYKIIEYWHILLLSFILGIINSIDLPARQSYIVELVNKKEMISAISLNSTVFNLARIAGPILAGVIMAEMDIAWCFLLNALSFTAFLYGLHRIGKRLPENRPSLSLISLRKKFRLGNLLLEIKDGLLYIYSNQLLYRSVVILFILGVLGFNFNILIPLLTKDILFLGEKGLGVLWGALGAGSLLGALCASNINAIIRPSIKAIVIYAILMSITLMMIGFDDFGGSENKYAYSIILLFLCGLFSMWLATTATSLMQLNTQDQYRGRVMSVYTLVFAGTTPLGNFITGLIAEHIHARFAFICNGLGTIIIMIIFLVLWKQEDAPIFITYQRWKKIALQTVVTIIQKLF